jgi:hypothetical protein
MTKKPYKDFDGLEYPSVTQITGQYDKSEAMVRWAVNAVCQAVSEGCTIEKAKTAYKDISKEALDVGSETHKLVEIYIKSGVDATKGVDVSEQAQNAFLAFLEWEKENNVKWHLSELQVFDFERYYAGTLDALASIDGVMYVIDFKTSKAHYKDYALQIAGYTQAYNAMRGKGNLNVKNCGILRLDKNSGFPNFKDYSKDLPQMTIAFNHLLDFYYAFRKRRLNNPRGTFKKIKE